MANIEEIVFLYQNSETKQGKDIYFKQIYKYFLGKINTETNKFSNKNKHINIDDTRQIILISLYNCCKKFNKECKTKFKVFFECDLRNRLKDFKNKEYRDMKNFFLLKKEDKLTENIVQKWFIEQDVFEFKQDFIRLFDKLNDYEKRILKDFYINDKDSNEIAKTLNVEINKFFRDKKRVTKKIRRIMEEN